VSVNVTSEEGRYNKHRDSPMEPRMHCSIYTEGLFALLCG